MIGTQILLAVALLAYTLSWFSMYMGVGQFATIILTPLIIGQTGYQFVALRRYTGWGWLSIIVAWITLINALIVPFIQLTRIIDLTPLHATYSAEFTVVSGILLAWAILNLFLIYTALPSKNA